jgi:hypothetical protein
VLRRRWLIVLTLVVASTAAHLAAAQSLEVSAFGGYRFGDDVYEYALGRRVDAAGAPSAGATVDLFVNRVASVTILFSHQWMRVPVVTPAGEVRAETRASVDHLHVGGTYALDGGLVRPYLSGGVGATRFGAAGDFEYRFSAGGGGGVKLMPARHVGFRLDGRAYAVFVDGHGGAAVCGGGSCAVNLHFLVLWQLEFTAGVVVAF